MEKKISNRFYESFNFILLGYNLRPLEIEAAVGIKQIDKIDSIVNNRRLCKLTIIAKKIMQLFINNPNIITQKEIGISSWFEFSIVLVNKLKGKRNEIIEKLNKSGIEVRPIVAGNFTRNKVIKFMDYEISGELMLIIFMIMVFL